MNRLTKSLAAGAVMLVPLVSNAEDFSYTYGEASWVKGDNQLYSGYSARGSFGFLDRFHVFGGYKQLDLDELMGDGTDAKIIEAGLGFHHALNQNVDFVGEISYIDAETDPGESESGAGVRALLRGRIGPNFELEGGVQYVDLSDMVPDTSFIVTGRYLVAPNFSIGATFETTGVGGAFGGLSLEEQVSITFRYSFGK